MAAMVPAGTHPAVVWGVILGAEAPDIDFVVRYWAGETGYLKDHRGPTHGGVSLFLLAAAIAGVLWILSPGMEFWTLFNWTLIGCLSHVLFDITNDYGTQALWPLSRRRIALDLVPIVDVWILGAIAGGWLLNWAWPGHRQAIFAGVWVLLGIYVLLRYWLRSRAMKLVCAAFEVSGDLGESVPCGSGWTEELISIHPTLFSLNAWRYVAKKKGEFLLGTVKVFDRKVAEPVSARNDMDRVVLASLKSQFVSTFAGWARRPRVEVDEIDGLFRVRWIETRYEVEGFSPFSALAWLDLDLNLVDDRFGRKRPEQMSAEAAKRRLRIEMGRDE